MFETDVPHRVCLEGTEIDDATNARMVSLSEETRERILWINAVDLYRLPNSRPSAQAGDLNPEPQ